MCGICGEVTFDRSPASVRAVAAMADAMAPRGPDGAGVVIHDEEMRFVGAVSMLSQGNEIHLH